MKTAKILAAGGMVAAGVHPVAGCSNIADDCRATLTCPVDSNGGRGAEGGAPSEEAGAGASDGGKAQGGRVSLGGGVNLQSGGSPHGGSPHSGDGEGGYDGDAAGGPNNNGGNNAGQGSRGGASSQGGAASQGGANTGEGKSCSRPEDCSDGLFCNGVERCVNSRCQSGTPPTCSNPDAAHCTVTCEETTSASKCTIQAKDTDGDGVGTNTCNASPGTDCDDARKDVYPGAKELCDGRDNDCDGRTDLEDGLVLSGTNVEIGDPTHSNRHSPWIAWSPKGKQYAITHVDQSESSSELMYEAVTQSGQRVATPFSIQTQATTAAILSIVASGIERFSVFWIPWESPWQLWRREVYVDGVTRGSVARVSDALPDWSFNPPRAAQLPDGNWGIINVALEQTPGRVLTSDWRVSRDEFQVWDRPMNSADLIAVGDRFALVFEEKDGTWGGELRDGRLDRVVARLDLPGTRPALGQGVNGFAVATTRPELPAALSVYKSDGTLACDPVQVGDKNFSPRAVVGTTSGYLIVHSDPSGVLHAQQVSAACAAGPVVSLGVKGSDVRVAGGEGGYGVVWEEA